MSSRAVFIDLSDYGRPISQWLALALASTPVTSIHITLLHCAVGLCAAFLIARADGFSGAVGGALLIVKSVLDGADGELARVRQRPSRVGRFLDSLCDLLVNLAVFGALALRIGLTPLTAIITALAFLSMMLGSSWYHYAVVAFKTQSKIATASRLDEDSAERYPWDNPAALRVLQAIYRLVYGWQDRLVAAVDAWLIPGERRRAAAQSDGALVTLVTLNGLGLQLFYVALMVWIGRPQWALWLFLGPMNVALVLWLAVRWLRYRS